MLEIVGFGLRSGSSVWTDHALYPDRHTIYVFGVKLSRKRAALDEMRAQSDRRGLMETGCDCAFQNIRVCEDLNVGRHAALLADSSKLPHGMNALDPPQALQRDRHVLRGLVVNFKRNYAQLPVPGNLARLG